MEYTELSSTARAALRVAEHRFHRVQGQGDLAKSQAAANYLRAWVDGRRGIENPDVLAHVAFVADEYIRDPYA